ncbi:MAG: S8 family peptidase [Bacteroidetes bacterium]|nr:S8 family peptidase [Bacteroidota bacterium]
MKKSIILFLFCLFTQQINSQIPSHGITQNANDLILTNQNGEIPALILVDKDFDESTLFKNNIKLETKAGDVWSVLVPKEQLSILSQISGIKAIEPALRINATQMKMDSVRKVMNVERVHNGLANGLPQNFTGKGVIVGIVDIGFDYKHPAFYALDSTTYRVSRVWQQNHDEGTPPSGYDYGSELVGKDEIFTDLDLNGTHGTHVAGIAAGSGIGSPNLKYQGHAPDAELVFVSLKYFNNSLPGSAMSDYLIANPAIIDAYNYIFNYAKSVGKPAVINLSWGMHTGPHDGTSLFDLATNNLIGEGLILVGAAGNEGTNPMHFEAKLKGDTVRTIVIENERFSYPKEEVYLDMWGSGNSVFSVSAHLIDTTGSIVYESPYFSSTKNGTDTRSFDTDSGKFSIIVFTNSYYVPNGKPNIRLLLTNPDPARYNIGLSITSPYSDIHAWNSGGIYRYTSGRFVNQYNQINFSSTYKAGNTSYTVGENGGTSKSVITAGAFTAKNIYYGIYNDTLNDQGYSAIGNITPFSSRGPTADGRIKPDILAPGMDVAAPIFLREYPGWAWNKLVAITEFNSDTFAYGVFSGTSMASPQVTGTVALMLQANPKLTSFQIKQILAKTAIMDDKTGAVPNNNAGWGKVNTYEAVKESYRILSAGNTLSQPHKITAYPNPTSDEVTVQSEHKPIEQIEVYSITGQLIYRKTYTEPLQTIKVSLAELHTGIYILKVNKQIIRLLVD